MVWSGRPRYEGGRRLADRQRAWAYAKNEVIQPSKNAVFQRGTTSYSDKARYNTTNRVKDGLLCEWWFDEGSGNTIIDRTPLTRESDLNWIQNAGAGLLGEWSQDSSQNDRYYLNLSAGGATRNTGSQEFTAGPIAANEVTMEAWFKPSDQAGLATTGPGRIATIVPVNTTYTDQCVMLGHGTWTGNASNHNARSYAARVKMYDTVHQLWSADDTAVTDQLVHLVVTAKYNTELNRAEARFYVDGVLVDSKNVYDDSSEIFEDWDPTARISTGAARDGEKKAKGGYYLTAVYRRALTSAEVSQNFEEGVSPQSGGYKKGTRAVLNDGASTLDAGKADKFEVSLSGGVHLNKLTVTLTASSDNTDFTLGEDFTLTPSTVDLPKGTYTKSVSLSCAADTSADHTVHVSVNSISNNGGITVVESPSNDANDSFDTAVTAKAVKPEVKFDYDTNPQIINSPAGALVDAFTVAKTRDYDEEVKFTVSGTATGSNTANYYLWSGTAPGFFSAPYQPGPNTTGPNNDIWKQTYGDAVTLSAYTGPMTITADDTVIENALFNNIGALRIKAKNCVVRNCKIFSDTTFYNLITNLDECENLIVEDCEFSGTGTFESNGQLKTNSTLILAGGDGPNRNATIRRCYFHDCAADHVKADGHVTIESCWFGRMGDTSLPGNPHCDAIQNRGGNNNFIRWNYFDIPAGDYLPTGAIHSAGIIIQGETADISGAVVDSNWFKGGSNGITLSVQDTDVQVFIVNNKFIGSEDDITNLGYHPYFTNWICQRGGGLGTADYNFYNNTMYDGSPAPVSRNGPNQSGGGGTILGYLDNLTAPPELPWYDGPVGSKVDLSDGITLRMTGDEISKNVTIYSEGTDSNGTFVDGDSISGVLVNASVTTGDDAGDSLSVCSTLSTLTVEFNEAGFARNGIGAGINIPVREPSRDFATTAIVAAGGLDLSTNDTPRTINTTILGYQDLQAITDEEILSRRESAPVGGETSATTGVRDGVTLTNHPYSGTVQYVDPGAGNSTNRIEVPAAGLVVSGMNFEQCRIKTTNPLRFVDCQFSGQTDFHNGITQSYVCWDNNQGGGNINKKVDFEYCDFRGGGSITFMMAFRTLYKCNFDDTISDMIRFRAGSYRVTNCYFGKYMNVKDSSLNSNNGQYNQNSGFSPHADVHQIYKSVNPIIHFGDCTFDQRPGVWSDDSTNPDHYLGASPDKIHQYGGSQSDPTATDLGEMRFTNCILNGGGNYMFSAKATSGPTFNCLPGNWSFKDCKFGTSCRSGIFAMADGHTLTDLGGNVWLETGTPGIKLPQEALDAGTTTNAGRDNLPISYVIRGLDNVGFSQDGLNEGGRSSWGQRGIGMG